LPDVKSPPTVLTIAGFDPSSGAGITADIKTIAAHGCYGVACITALTVQSTSGVRRVVPVAPEVLTETLQTLYADMKFAAVHVGMLGTCNIANAVADFLEAKKLKNVVLDLILKSSSGKELLDADGMQVMSQRLLRLADVVTPNVDEAAALTGMRVTNLQEMRRAAERLHEMGAPGIVITGGHLDDANDLLSQRSGRKIMQKVFSGKKLRSIATHGTGCAFATALACELALGRKLPEAVLRAKNYVREAIAHGYPIGKGIGPVNHSYKSLKILSK
jgi:hydroxymethylpyrimidine/phosphomethylpyrimidine kinase